MERTSQPAVTLTRPDKECVDWSSSLSQLPPAIWDIIHFRVPDSGTNSGCTEGWW